MLIDGYKSVKMFPSTSPPSLALSRQGITTPALRSPLVRAGRCPPNTSAEVNVYTRSRARLWWSMLNKHSLAIWYKALWSPHRVWSHSLILSSDGCHSIGEHSSPSFQSTCKWTTSGWSRWSLLVAVAGPPGHRPYHRPTLPRPKSAVANTNLDKLLLWNKLSSNPDTVLRRKPLHSFWYTFSLV